MSHAYQLGSHESELFVTRTTECLEDLAQLVDLRHATEEHRAVDHLGHDDAKTPHVGGRGVSRVVQQTLGSAVRGGGRVLEQRHSEADGARHAKVAQLEALALNQDVLGSQVAMHHLHRVQLAQSHQQLCEVVTASFRRRARAAVIDLLMQCAIEKLEHQQTTPISQSTMSV